MGLSAGWHSVGGIPLNVSVLHHFLWVKFPQRECFNLNIHKEGNKHSGKKEDKQG